MHPMPDRISPRSLGRLQLRMRKVLRPVGVYPSSRQGQGSNYVGGDSAVQAEPAPVRHRWFAERAFLGTTLSDDEVRHGVNAGILASSLLMDGAV